MEIPRVYTKVQTTAYSQYPTRLHTVRKYLQKLGSAEYWKSSLDNKILETKTKL